MSVALGKALSSLLGETPLIIMCDFDGVIAPIVEYYDDVDPLVGSLASLNALSAAKATTVAVVSGRSYTNLCCTLKVTGAVQLIGGHGADTGQLPDPALTAALSEIERSLRRGLASTPGCMHIESKSTGLAVHCRAASVDEVYRLLLPIAQTYQLRCSRGINVVEVRARGADKGAALGALKQSHNGARAVVIGDDITDEDAFIAADPCDITIKVGSGITAARYRVAHPTGVSRVLELLAGARNQHAVSVSRDAPRA